MLATLMFGQVDARPTSTTTSAGGKSQGMLVCNEVSRQRLQRLQKVLSSFLPSEYMAAGGKVAVANTDATRVLPGNAGGPPALSRFGQFDRILVDAPCSSDRHLLRQGAKAFSNWSSGSIKANAERQLDILFCAATLIKPGGRILYCTCALAEAENDGVIKKFLKKHGKAFEVESLVGADADEAAVKGQDESEPATKDIEPESKSQDVKDEVVEVAGGATEEPTPTPSLTVPLEGSKEAAQLLARGDRTEMGVLLLPDRSSYGPMYMSALRRVR